MEYPRFKRVAKFNRLKALGVAVLIHALALSIVFYSSYNDTEDWKELLPTFIKEWVKPAPAAPVEEAPLPNQA